MTGHGRKSISGWAAFSKGRLSPHACRIPTTKCLLWSIRVRNGMASCGKTKGTTGIRDWARPYTITVKGVEQLPVGRLPRLVFVHRHRSVTCARKKISIRFFATLPALAAYTFATGASFSFQFQYPFLFDQSFVLHCVLVYWISGILTVALAGACYSR